MRTVIIALILVLGSTPNRAETVFDDVTDVTRWKVAGAEREIGDERFMEKTTAKEMLDTWSYDTDRKRKFQCNNQMQYCIAVQCEYGRPQLLITDPANRGYKIRFWSMDYEKKVRTPLPVSRTMFEFLETGYFASPTVRVTLTPEIVARMTFGDTMRIAYSFPLGDRAGEEESPNDIFVHMDSSDGPIDSGAMFEECAATTNLKTE